MVFRFKLQKIKLETKRGGFTLIELLLYISIAATMILLVLVFLFGLLESRVKNQTITEVEQQGRQIMELVTQIIRNSQDINSLTPNTLVLDRESGLTTFTLIGSTIYINEGLGNIPLNSSRVEASNLNFLDLSRSSTPGIIRIQFVLTHLNLEGKNEYDYSKTFYGSASLR